MSELFETHGFVKIKDDNKKVYITIENDVSIFDFETNAAAIPLTSDDW